MERSDVDLVLAARTNDAQAFGDLFERWYDRVFDVARNVLRDSEMAAEVAQDVFLAMWQRLDQLEDPTKFGGWALRISRNRALNRLEKEKRSLSFESETMTGLHEQAHGGEGDRDDLVGSNRLLETEAISEVRDRQDLLWAATAALGERDASLVDLVLRHQLTPAEIADELDIEPNNAHQLLFRLRNKVGDAVANHLVWRSGQPRCGELHALVGTDSTFDAKTNKAVQKHSSSCATCGAEREKVVDPQKLFAAVPVAIAPALLKANTAAALAAQGVPIDPARFSPGGSGGGSTGGRGEGPAVSRATDSPPTTAGRRHRKPRRSRRARAVRSAGFVTAGFVVLAGVLIALSRPVADGVQVEVAAPVTTTTSEAPRTTPSTTAAPRTTPSTTAPPTEDTPRTTPSTTEPVIDDGSDDDGPGSTPSTTTEIDDFANPSVSLTVVTLEPSFVLPPPAPQILRLRAQEETGAAIGCPEFELPYRISWTSQNTDDLQFVYENESTAQDPTGFVIACFGIRDTATVTATGPGGSTSESITPIP